MMKIIPRIIRFTKNNDDWTKEEEIMSKLVIPLTNALIDKYVEYEEDNLIAQDILQCLVILIVHNKEKLSKNKFIRKIGPFPKDKDGFNELINVTNAGQVCVVMEDKNESMNLDKSLVDEMSDFSVKEEPRKEAVEILLKKMVESSNEVKLHI